MKSAIFAPMPSASTTIAVSAKDGARINRRMPWRTSRASDSSHCQLHVSRACSRTTAGLPKRRSAACRASVSVHAGGAVLGDLLVKMEAQFVLELDIRGAGG